MPTNNPFGLSATRGISAIVILASALTLGACTGGSSSGTPSSTAAPSSSPTPNPSASRIAHANPLVYQAVTGAQAKKIETIAARAPGVQSVSYDNQHKTISLYLLKSITGAERIIADRVVNQVLHPAVTPRSSSTTKRHKHK